MKFKVGQLVEHRHRPNAWRPRFKGIVKSVSQHRVSVVWLDNDKTYHLKPYEIRPLVAQDNKTSKGPFAP